MPYSPPPSCMRCRRFNSLLACLATSSGIPASSSAFFSSSISAAVSSPSPSSFWIWRICSRSTCSRWRSSKALRVWSPISFDSLSTSTRLPSSASTLSRRARTLKASSSSCFCSGFTSRKFATMSASAPGESMPCTTAARPSGAFGSSSIAAAACCLSCRKRASSSAPDSCTSSTIATRATRNGQPSRNSSTRKRDWPWTTRWCAPSGAVT